MLLEKVCCYVPVVQNFPATSGVSSKFPERIKLGFSWKYFRFGELAYRKLTEGGSLLESKVLKNRLDFLISELASSVGPEIDVFIRGVSYKRDSYIRAFVSHNLEHLRRNQMFCFLIRGIHCKRASYKRVPLQSIPSTEPITPGLCQSSHWNSIFLITSMTRLWLESRPPAFEAFNRVIELVRRSCACCAGCVDRQMQDVLHQWKKNKFCNWPCQPQIVTPANDRFGGAVVLEVDP